MKFGDFLRDQRQSKSWTQPQAADKIGIEQSYLSKLETGKAIPGEEIFNKLAEAYGFDIDTMGRTLLSGDLAKLKDIKAVQEYVTTRERSDRTNTRKWLIGGLLLLGLGAAITSYQIHRPRYITVYEYTSKGVIKDGESDYLFAEMPTESSLRNLISRKSQYEGWLQELKHYERRIYLASCEGVSIRNIDPKNPKPCMIDTMEVNSLERQLRRKTESFVDIIKTSPEADGNRVLGPKALLELPKSTLARRLKYQKMILTDRKYNAFTKTLDNGRRLYRFSSQYTRDLGARNAWLFAFGPAFMVMGLACFFIARKWR